MIALYPVALGLAGYVGIGTIGFLVIAWICIRQGDPIAEHSSGLLLNSIVVACLILLIPLAIAAAPFVTLHALCTGRWGGPPARSNGGLPAGFCLRFADGATRPTLPIDPLELPAYLRRHVDQPPVMRVR